MVVLPRNVAWAFSFCFFAVYNPCPLLTTKRSDGVGFTVIGHTDLRATLLEKASSLVQGFGGGLLVLQVCTPKAYLRLPQDICACLSPLVARPATLRDFLVYGVDHQFMSEVAVYMYRSFRRPIAAPHLAQASAQVRCRTVAVQPTQVGLRVAIIL